MGYGFLWAWGFEGWGGLVGFVVCPHWVSMDKVHLLFLFGMGVSPCAVAANSCMLLETALSAPQNECEGNHCSMYATFAADVCCTLQDVEARAISYYETYPNKRCPEKTREAVMQR